MQITITIGSVDGGYQRPIGDLARDIGMAGAAVVKADNVWVRAADADSAMPAGVPYILVGCVIGRVAVTG